MTPHKKITFGQDGTSVPSFQVFKQRKKAEINNRNVQVEVIKIKTVSENKSLLYHLMCQSAEQNILSYKSKCVPHRMNIKPHTCLGMVKIMSIVGLSRQTARHTGPTPNQASSSYIQHVSNKLKAITIQPTTRTEDLGEWLILIKDGH